LTTVQKKDSNVSLSKRTRETRTAENRGKSILKEKESKRAWKKSQRKQAKNGTPSRQTQVSEGGKESCSADIGVVCEVRGAIYNQKGKSTKKLDHIYLEKKVPTNGGKSKEGPRYDHRRGI